jgi:hypothetical protein
VTFLSVIYTKHADHGDYGNGHRQPHPGALSASQVLGLALDNLASVTADGRVLHASDDDNADLFWAFETAAAISASPHPSNFVSIQSDR